MGEGEGYVLALPSNRVENRHICSSRSEMKRVLGCVVDEAELEGPLNKKHGIECLNSNVDDVYSEVSNLSGRALTKNENASSLETDDLSDSNLVHYGQLTPESSGNSCGVSCSDEESRRCASSDGVSTSALTLEIPKHACTTGIRKITFKFSKSKKENRVPNGFHEGDSVIDSNDDLGLDDHAHRFLHKMELKMSKKVVLDTYPTNVKKLLATGILEGAKVKYVSTSGEKEILGEVRGCGYLCGCSVCNYTNVLSAYEFERHAGGAKTRHPNNHIFLENGKPIYSIIEELKTAPLGLLEEVVKDVAGSSVNHGSFHARKETLRQCNKLVQTDKKHPKVARSISPTQLRPSSASGFSGPRKKSSEGATRKRDNDLHRLLFLPNGLPDGTELAYYARGQKILDGYKNGNGIVCAHCCYEISPSQFEAHAGWAARKQPYRNIYTANGYSLHDIAISLANGQKLTVGNNDDMCTVCGDGGELIPCGVCPRAYHQACLGLQNVPVGDWHCPKCNDRRADFTGSSNNSKPTNVPLTRVVKNSEAECGGCFLCRGNDFSVDKFDDRTVIICDQCEKEYHVGCLRDSGLCDLNELPQDKWFCCRDCERIHGILRDLVVRGPEAIATESIKVSRKHNEWSFVTDNDVQWHIMSGKCRDQEHLPLLSQAVSIFRECFSPITAKTGRDLIPVMVHGRNISGQEFGGVYCVLLIVKSVVVSAGLLRIFGREIAELPLVATSKEYQRKGYFLALFSRIEKLLYALKVENLVLPAAEKAKAMWVYRLGFREMSEERLSLYTRDYQLTEFNGTEMLEKKLEQKME